MSKRVKPTSSIHTFGAPYAKHPEAIAISPEAHVVLPIHGSIWSGATITYVVLAIIMLIAFWWAGSKPVKNEPFKNQTIKTAVVGAYLLVGFLIAVMFSYTKNTMYSWIIVFGLLVPVAIVLFWGVYHYHVISTAPEKEG